MKTESLLVAAAAALGFMLAVGTTVGVMPMFHGNTARVVAGTLGFHGGILFGAMILLRMEGLGWRESFGFRGLRSLRAVGGAALTTLLFLPVALGLSWVSASMMRYFFVEPVQQQAVQAVQEATGAVELGAMAVMAVVVAPFAEEVLFRGLLYPLLRPRWGSGLACLVTSLMFGAIHFNAMSFLPLTLFAVVLVALYEGTGTLLAPVTAHALFNFANFALLLLVP
jgi:membrane protease YdiL (CAAX protease family)